MKKAKPNLSKMFNFHTIILVILVLVVSTFHTHTSEGKLQRLHKHKRNHSYKQHNVVVVDATNDDNGDRQQQSDGQNHHHQHHQQHHHHHHSHSHRQQQHSSHHHQRPYDANTPSLEFTTSSSASSSATATITGDNEFLIKQHTQPLHNKDEIYYKTKELQPSSATAATANTSSTTSKPPISIRLMKQNVHNLKTSIHERSHHSHSGRLVSTPLTIFAEGNSGINHNSGPNNFATMYMQGFEDKNSNWNRTTKDVDDARTQSEQSVQHLNQTHKVEKPELNHVQQRPQQNFEDYYSDADDDDDLDDDGDNDYSEDEGDNDGLSYDDDNNLSDRSYARITRSKLDDDYIDDEPYRNGINDFSMQRDAAPGVLTEQKYLEVGNEKAVQQARERYIQEQKRPRTPHELATEHWHRMIQATKCRKPLPRVIPVSNNTSKRYEPYATILHRCGDDTGCCGSTASVCTVKRHEIVMVYVFSYDFNYRKEIEALPMQNHTECHCVNRGSLLHDSMPRDKRSGGSSSYSHHLQRQQRKQQQEKYESDSQLYPQILQYHHHQQPLQNMLDCHCPRHFNVFEEDVERHVHLPQPHSEFIRKCRCDCLVNNQTCLRFKHGEEGFSLEDRKCILEHNCKPPYCSYGEYNSRVGRCPSYRSHLLKTT